MWLRAVRTENLREILHSQPEVGSGVLDIYGNGRGCEICKPALSYMLDIGAAITTRTVRFINDRVHANIQKDGTFQSFPDPWRRHHTRGAARIADVAEMYTCRW